MNNLRRDPDGVLQMFTHVITGFRHKLRIQMGVACDGNQIGMTKQPADGLKIITKRHPR